MMKESSELLHCDVIECPTLWEMWEFGGGSVVEGVMESVCFSPLILNYHDGQLQNQRLMSEVIEDHYEEVCRCCVEVMVNGG